MNKQQQIEEKEKQIEEMKDIVHNLWDKLNQDAITTNDIISALYNAGYRKLPEDSVVLSREEYKRLLDNAIRVDMEYLDHELAKERKETAKEIFQEINNYLKLYSYIHNYAQEARKSKEQYADGEPVEMESVWDVITLNKNGYADYETMNTLQDNIENIANSQLLREIEKNFRLFAKQFGVEIKE